MPAMTPVFGQRAALEAGEHHVAPRPVDVAEHAEDVDRELLDLVAFEDRAADAGHARTHLVDRHVPWRGHRPGDQCQRRDGERTHDPGIHARFPEQGFENESISLYSIDSEPFGTAGPPTCALP